MRVRKWGVVRVGMLMTMAVPIGRIVPVAMAVPVGRIVPMAMAVPVGRIVPMAMAVPMSAWRMQLAPGRIGDPTAEPDQGDAGGRVNELAEALGDGRAS